ncbi:hypothetical protein GEMRC1_000846 [Eukaryota sp. GEM-RC1]
MSADKRVFSAAASWLQMDANDLEISCKTPEMNTELESFLAGKEPNILLFFKTDKGVTFTTTIPPNTKGSCVFFIRPNPKPVSSHSFNTEVFSAFIPNNLLSDIATIFSSILTPTVRSSKDVSSLTQAQRDLFLSALDNFSVALTGGLNAVDIGINFSPPSSLFGLSNSPSDFAKGAKDPEIVTIFDRTLCDWCKQLERILAESNQVRQESTDSGPLAELEHWKQRMAKFNTILDLSQAEHISIIIGVLSNARPALLDEWKKLQRRVRDDAIEAEDNLKYLYIVDKVARPLYQPNPARMLECLPQLMSSIAMVHRVTRFYNTNERLTGLFVKITNQMVVSCRRFIHEGLSSFWGLTSVKDMTKRLKQCSSLGSEYRSIYRKTKDSLSEAPTGRQFDLSEAYIFGPMDLFVQRIAQLLEILEAFEQFSSLKEANISGLTVVSDKFFKIYADFQRKQPKPFDDVQVATSSFEKDFTKYKSQISDLEKQLITVVDELFANSTTTEHSIELLNQIPDNLLYESFAAALNAKYPLVFRQYTSDLENIRRQYQQFATKPPIARNRPPVSGAIEWARQLARRIQEPMELFQERAPHVLSLPDGRKTVRTYNKLSQALFEYESLYFKAWVDSIQTARQSLYSPVFIRKNFEDPMSISVQFSSSLSQLLAESKWLSLMGLDIPGEAASILVQEDRLRKLRDQFGLIVSDYKNLLSKIKEPTKDLLEYYLSSFEKSLAPGYSVITWSSVSIEQFSETISSALGDLKSLVKESNDIFDFRIESVINEISESKFIEYEEEPVLMSEFLSNCRTKAEEAALLSRRSLSPLNQPFLILFC